MQIDMLQLNVLQTQLDNVSMQATLIIGFALGMWGGETLDPLTDDEGPHCVFKSWGRSAIAVVFFSAIAVGLWANAASPCIGPLGINRVEFTKKAANCFSDQNH